MSDYPNLMTLRPIEHWPGTLTENRSTSPFSAPWRATLDLLDRELWHLGDGHQMPESVLQIAMRENDFRLDGMPRANAKPEHPGVIVSVESAKGHLSFPCDTFINWHDNLRAIALALEALRRVDRYGITPNDEQYTGWKQLPGPPTSPKWDAEFAEKLIRTVALTVPASRVDDPLRVLYRVARSVTHPDRNDGDRQGWDSVERAADILRAAGKL